jgi:hypothetical protein
MQQGIHGRQRQGALEPGFQPRLDLTDDEDAAVRRFVEEGAQQFGFLLDTEVRMVAPSPAGFFACSLARDESVAQMTDPSGSHAQRLGRLTQTQAMTQRQHHSLRLAKLFQTLRRRQYDQRLGHRSFSLERSRHDPFFRSVLGYRYITLLNKNRMA